MQVGISDTVAQLDIECLFCHPSLAHDRRLDYKTDQATERLREKVRNVAFGA